MNYQEALAYLYGRNDFERGGTFTNDSEQHLLREGRLLELLGNPQHAYSSTLIAGTKGKGSTAACLERVLRAAGVHTGLYTQPDLHTFRERIRINGSLISETDVAELLSQIRQTVEQIEQSPPFLRFIPYEITTALGLLSFQRQSVQHAVLEVGLGGRLDATNITEPLVSVIASISYDHMDVLGHTLTAIATEKAGIIKPGRVVVTSAQSPEALLAIARVARERQARLVRVGPIVGDPAQAEVESGQVPPVSYHYQAESQRETDQTFTVFAPGQTYRDLEVALAGLHQAENATLALAALEELRATGRPECAWDEAALREGLRAVSWSARLEIIARQPTIVVDGAHNADSVQKLLTALRSLFTFQRLLIVLGVNTDKDLSGIITELIGVDQVILTSTQQPRAARPEDLRELFARYAPQVSISLAEGSRSAMELACSLAGPADLICATGSLYLAAEILRQADTASPEQKA